MLLESLDYLSIDDMRDREGHVMEIADPLGIGHRIIRARWAHKEGDQAPIAGVEVEVLFSRDVQVGLGDHQPHAEHALVEGNGRLAIRADEGQVMNALNLELDHNSVPSKAPEKGVLRKGS